MRLPFRIPLLSRELRAGLCLACLGLSVVPLHGQRTLQAAAQEELRTFLVEFTESWCAGEDFGPLFDLARCRAEI